MRVASVLALFLLVLAGCARNRSTTPPPGSTGSASARSTVIVTPGSLLKGRVASVNPLARFVVLSFPLGTMPALDTRLNVYRGGLKVGEIKVSGPPLDINTVADIVAGECRVGDEVREQ